MTTTINFIPLRPAAETILCCQDPHARTAQAGPNVQCHQHLETSVSHSLHAACDFTSHMLLSCGLTQAIRCVYWKSPAACYLVPRQSLHLLIQWTFTWVLNIASKLGCWMTGLVVLSSAKPVSKLHSVGLACVVQKPIPTHTLWPHEARPSMQPLPAGLCMHGPRNQAKRAEHNYAMGTFQAAGCPSWLHVSHTTLLRHGYCSLLSKQPNVLQVSQ